MAPQVGLEPTTLRLTAECSAIELLRNVESGGDLLSRAVTSQVPSALKGLTSVFGMGTGGTPSSLPPEMVSYKLKPLSILSSVFLYRDFVCQAFRSSFSSSVRPVDVFTHPDNCTAFRFSPLTVSINLRITRCNQALDRLVSSSCMRYRTSTDDLSTR